MALTIDELQIEIQAKSTSAASGVDALAVSLGKLRASARGGIGLTTATNQLERFLQAVQAMQVPSQKIAELVSALKPLETIGKSNLGSALNQLKKIPEITKGLDPATLSDFAAKIVQVTDAVRPLATEMEKVSAGFSKLPANIQRAINANARLTKTNKTTAFGFNMLAAKIAIVYAALRRVGRVIGGWIKEGSDYVENLNLFTVAMGEYAESAKKYAEQVQEAVGIDASQFMRYQGVFMNMARGFGVASDKAATMSKNLTQLGYDLASLYNVKFDTAMEKLESALSGQPRPMREWGFDLSEATLKAKALELGIEKNVELMSQAEKSQIRYIQLLETAQKIGATGDFARTLNTAANQIRILQSSATLAARALGNIFIPALNAVLPYAIAFLKVIRWVAQELANLFGFTLPEIDYSGLDGFASGADDAADALGDAAGAAKDLKNATLGIDELNVISPQTGGGSSPAASGAGGDLGLDLPEYDFLGELMGGRVSEIFESWKKTLEPIIEWLKKNMDTIWGIVKDIGIAFLAWEIGKSILTGVAQLIELAKVLPRGLTKAAKIAAGLVIAIVGIKWSYEAGFAIGSGKAEFMDYVKAVLGPIAASVGGALIGSAILPGVGTTFGFLIGLTVGVLMELKGIIDGMEAARVVGAFTDSMENANVPIEEFASAAANAFREIGGVSSIVAGYGQTILDENVKIDEAKTKIDTYMGAWQATGKITTTEIGIIIGQLDLLVNASEANLTAAALALNTTLVDALKNATAETKETYNGLLNMIYLLESNGNTVLAGWKMELNNATETLNSLDESSLTYTADAAILVGKISDLTIKIYGLGDSSYGSTSKLEDLNAAVNGIDFSNLSDSSGTAQNALDDLTSVATTAYTDAAGAYKANQDSLDEMFRYIDTSSPQWKAIYDNALDLGLDSTTVFGDTEAVKTFMQGYFTEIYNAEVAQIDALFKDTYGVIASSLADAVNAAAEKSAGELVTRDKDWWANHIYRQDYEALGGINNPTATAEIERQMTDMWSKAVENAAKALEEDETIAPIFDALERSISSVQSARALTGAGGSMAESLVGGVSEGFTNSVSQALAKQGLNKLAGLIEEFGMNAIDAHSPAGLTIPHGEYLTAGIAEGLTDATSKIAIKTAMGEMGGTIIGEFDTYFKLGTGAAVFSEKGKALLTDLSSGITNNANIVTDAMDTLLNTLITKMETFTNRMRDAVNKMLGDFAKSMSSVSVTSSGSVNYTPITSVTIPRFAGGGFPNPGELFLARERGPEMVGTMGGRTAVANNGQIVEGIREGVYDAVVAAMARADGGENASVNVYLDGKQINASVRKTQRERAQE